MQKGKAIKKLTFKSEDLYKIQLEYTQITESLESKQKEHDELSLKIKEVEELSCYLLNSFFQFCDVSQLNESAF